MRSPSWTEKNMSFCSVSEPFTTGFLCVDLAHFRLHTKQNKTSLKTNDNILLSCVFDSSLRLIEFCGWKMWGNFWASALRNTLKKACFEFPRVRERNLIFIFPGNSLKKLTQLIKSIRYCDKIIQSHQCSLFLKSIKETFFQPTKIYIQSFKPFF